MVRLSEVTKLSMIIRRRTSKMAIKSTVSVNIPMYTEQLVTKPFKSTWRNRNRVNVLFHWGPYECRFPFARRL